MSFYVGQRVRIVGDWDWDCATWLPPVNGREATIVGHGEFFGLSGKKHPWKVAPDGFQHPVLATSADIAPLLPPGLESLEDINALYETEPCEADV